MKLYKASKNLYLEIEKLVDKFDEITGPEYEDEHEELACESAQRGLDSIVDMLRAFRNQNIHPSSEGGEN